MTREETADLLDRVGRQLDGQAKLIRLVSGRAVFVGDTHGDLQATQKVIERYLMPENRIVFLGDYVDRGPSSIENVNTLLQAKCDHPDNVFLLMGNHEGHLVQQFYPADFWQGLDAELRDRYANILSRLPLAASTSNGILSLHGALPDIQRLDDIDAIPVGSQLWRQIAWGDWQERAGGSLGEDVFTGRPQFGQDWFDRIMGRLGKNLLIRSHQPNVRRGIYGGRCVTIFTSSAYQATVSERTIAVSDLEEEVRTVDDLLIEAI